MFDKISQFIKSFPATKDLSPEQKSKAMDIFNALKKEGIEDGKAIAIAMDKAKGMNEMPCEKIKKEMMEEIFNYISVVELKETKSIIEVLRVGMIQDRGLNITTKMLADFVDNFKNNAYGTNDASGAPMVQVNLGHDRDGEAAGWIKDLFLENDKLKALVEWTELGIEKIKKGLFKFISAELAPKFPHAKEGKLVQNVLMGAALTNTPALKLQQPITLSEEADKLLKNIVMLQKLLDNLKTRELVSVEDKKLLDEMLAGLSDEDKKQYDETVAEIKAKPEVKEEEKKEEEKKEKNKEAKNEEKKEAENKEELKEKANVEKMSELEKENQSLKEKLEDINLNETVKQFIINKEKNIGFLGEQSVKIVSFLKGLTVDQRNEFKDLISQIKHVDLEEKGSSDAENNQQSDKPMDEQAAELAENLMKENKDLTIEKAQKMAVEKLSKK